MLASDSEDYSTSYAEAARWADQQIARILDAAGEQVHDRDPLRCLREREMEGARREARQEPQAEEQFIMTQSGYCFHRPGCRQIKPSSRIEPYDPSREENTGRRILPCAACCDDVKSPSRRAMAAPASPRPRPAIPLM